MRMMMVMAFVMETAIVTLDDDGDDVTVCDDLL